MYHSLASLIITRERTVKREHDKEEDMRKQIVNDGDNRMVSQRECNRGIITTNEAPCPDVKTAGIILLE